VSNVDRPAVSIVERLVHIDAYRLDGAEELSTLGWEELVNDQNNLIVVEWAEQVAEVIPDSAIWLRFEVSGEEQRAITKM
jgi:tRNA A37 threonylcarbamoyladenosine biosynthesis protein TsaE